MCSSPFALLRDLPRPPPTAQFSANFSESDMVSGSVVDSHHVDADPDWTNHPDADPDSDFYLMRIQVTKMMRIHADPDPQ
jgi:hypothetical protein